MAGKTASWRKTLHDAVYAVVGKISRDCVFAYAGQASFFLIISSVPFCMLILSVLRYFLPLTQEEILSKIEPLLPDSVYSFAQTLSDELFSKASVPIISITALALLWASSGGIRALSEGIRSAYGTRFETPYYRKYLLSLANTFLFLVVILASVGLMLFGGRLISLLEEHLTLGSNLIRILLGLRGLIFLTMLTLIFTVLFDALGERSIRFLHHLPGAVFASVGWVIYSWGYSVYAENYSNYSYIYGSLAAIVLLMLWVYMCMTILLLGAELNGWLLVLTGKRSSCENS